jgi:predicted nucleotidyltransferase
MSMGSVAQSPWMVTREKIAAAVAQIVALVKPTRIVLFGSSATAAPRPDSDADFLIVTKEEARDTRRESVRVRRALRGIPMAMDIIVVSERTLTSLAATPGLVYREAIRHGEVVYEERR